MASDVFVKPWGNYLLKNIAETPAPEPVSWLPQTLGWQILCIFALIFGLNKLYSVYKSYKRNAYRRVALQWIKQLEGCTDIQLFRQLPKLLRKTAILAFGRTDVLHLSDKCWEEWLDKQCAKTSFSHLCPTLLHQLAFAPSVDISTHQYEVLIEQVKLWIAFHRRHDD